MKKTALIMFLVLSFALTACKQSDTTGTDQPKDNESTSTSVIESTQDENKEPSSTEPEVTTQTPAEYEALIEQYTTALNEKWSGETLVENDLNFMVTSFYENNPLTSVGSISIYLI